MKSLLTIKPLTTEHTTESIPSDQNESTNLENYDSALEDTIAALTNEYRLKGLSKDVCLRAVNEALANKQKIHNFGAYLEASLRLHYIE